MRMLTPTELFWIEIAACFCLESISCLPANLWTKSAVIGSGGYSPVAGLVPSAFGSIGALLIAHLIEGTVLTTTGSLPPVVFFLPVAAMVVVFGTLVACFGAPTLLERVMLLTFSGVSGATSVLLFSVLAGH